MKTSSKYVFLFLSFFLLFYSCSEEEVVKEDSLETFNELNVFDETGGMQSVSFMTSNSWTASTDQAWCKVTPATGEGGNQSLQVTVDPNEDYGERNAALLIKAGTKQKRLTITQKQKNAILLTSDKQEINADGGTVEVQIKSNVNPSYKIDASAVEWIIPVADRGLTTSTYKFRIMSNDSQTKREGRIIFFNDDLSETYTVYQEGTEPQFILTKDKFNVGPESQEIKVELKSNLPYEIILPDVDWISKQRSRSLSSYTHYFAIDRNVNYEDRTAKIIFKQTDSGLTKTVTVNQKQKSDILVGQTEYMVDSKGGSITVEVETNTDFSVTCNESWITERKNNSKALSKKYLVFDIQKNTFAYQRAAVITLESENISKHIKVIQYAEGSSSSFEILSNLHTFGAKEETQILRFKAAAVWKARNLESWCKMSPISGTKGEHSMKITVADIDNVARRIDTVYIETEKASLKVPVIQQNEDELIVLTQDINTSGLNDTIINVQLRSTYKVDYEIEKDAKSWILPVATRDLMDSKLQFKLLANHHALKRQGVITFINGNKKQKLTIVQGGKGLDIKILPKSIELVSDSTEFEAVVTSNFKYKVFTKSSEWIKTISSENIPCDSYGYTSTKHRFAISKNHEPAERWAYIYFLNEEYKDELGKDETNFLTIKQKSYNIIKIPQTTFEIPAKGQIVSLDITSNVDYEVNIGQPWIKLLPATKASLTKKNLQFEIEPNTDAVARKGYVTIKHDATGWQREIRFLQEGLTDYGILITDSLKEFSCTGEAQTLKFKASEAWKVTSNQKWCTLSATSGEAGDQTITVTTTANPDFTERIATLAFTCGEKKLNLPVVQKQNDHFELTQNDYHLAWDATILNMNVKANCAYTVEVSQPWLKRKEKSRTLSSETVSFDVEKNMGDTLREAKVTFSYLDKKKEVKVFQNPMDSLKILSPDVTVSGVKDTLIKVQLNSTSSVTYQIDERAKKWIIPENTRALTQSEFAFKVLKNSEVKDREGIITFTNGTKKANFRVTQKGVGLILKLSADTVNINSTSQQITLTARANFGYQIQPSQNWINEIKQEFVPDSEGLITAKHVFLVNENSTADSRKCELKFVNTQFEGMQLTSLDKVVVQQHAKDMIVIPEDKKTYRVSSLGQDLLMDVQSNVKYEVKTSAEWIKYIVETRGLITSKLHFKIDKNTATFERTGYIVLDYPTCSDTIKVIQEPFDDYGIKVEKNLSVFETAGGSQELKFSSSLNWVAESNQPWCKLSAVDGKAGKENLIKVTVDPNPEFKDRTADVVIKAGGHKTTIKVTQKQKDHIVVPTQPVKAAWNEEELNISVDANSDYLVTESCDWLVVTNRTSKSISLKLLQNTSIAERSYKLKVACGGVDQFITVVQGPHPVEVKVPEPQYNRDWKEQQIDVKVIANCDFKVTSSQSWLIPKKDVGSTLLHLKLQENKTAQSREATVTLSYNEVNLATIKVVQGPKNSISVNPSEYLVTWDKTSYEAKVTADCDFTASCKEAWIESVTVNGRTGVTVNFKQNTTVTERKATVTLTAKDIPGVSTAFTVVQGAHPAFIAAAETTYSPDWLEQDIHVTVYTNCPYEFKSDVPWLTVTKENSGLILSLGNNNNLTSRTAHVTLSYKGEVTETITVIQGPKSSIKVEKAEYTLNWNETNCNVKVTHADCDFEGRSPAKWVKSVTVNDRKEVVVTMDQNNTIEPREAVVTLTATDVSGATTTFKLKQGPRPAYVTPSSTKYSRDWKEQDVVIDVESNCKYDCQSNKPWVKISPNNGKVKLHLEANNESNSRSATVTFKYQNATLATVDIEQAPKSSISVEPNIREVEWNITELTISNVKADCDFTGSSDSKDVTVSVMNRNSVFIRMPQNNLMQAVEHTITLTSKDNPDVKGTFVVKQGPRPAYIQLESGTPGKYTRDYLSQDINITVHSNCKYDFVSDQEWAVVTQTNKGINIHLSQNNKAEKRDATVTLSYGSVQVQIKVEQTPKPSFKVVDVPKAKWNTSKLTVKIQTEFTDYEAFYYSPSHTEQGWFRVIDKNQKSVVLELDNNMNITSRTHWLRLQKDDVHVDILIEQGAHPAYYINVPKEPVKLQQNGNNDLNFEVNGVSTNGSFTAEANQDWVIPEVKGGKLYLKWLKKEDAGSRSAIITLKCIEDVNVSSEFTVIQDGMAEPYIRVTSPGIYGSQEQDIFIEVEANYEYSVKVKEGINWLTGKSPQKGKLKLHLAENPTVGGQRTAEVALEIKKAGRTVSETVTVTQNGKEAPQFTGDNSAKIDSKDQDLTVKVGANYPYTVAVENGKDWLTGTQSQNGDLQLHAEANITVVTRSAKVTLTSTVGETVKTHVVTVTQTGAAASIKVTENPTGTVASKGGSFKLNVESNCDFTVKIESTNGDGWLTANPAVGKQGTTEVTLEVTKNESTELVRKGTVKFIHNETVVHSFDITQDKATAAPTPDPVPEPDVPVTPTK